MCKKLFQQVETALVTPKVLEAHVGKEMILPQIFILTLTLDVYCKERNNIIIVATVPLKSMADLIISIHRCFFVIFNVYIYIWGTDPLFKSNIFITNFRSI